MPLAWVPYADRAEAERRLKGIPVGLELDFYRADGEELPGTVDEVAFYVLPYMKGPAVLARAAEMPKLQVVQTLTAGDEEFLPLVPPGVTLCNAAGLHDTSTAELAIALALASGRHLDEFARNQSIGAWRFAFGRALADQRVLIVGYGHIGRAIEQRLDGFEVASVTRVARHARTGPTPVYPIEDLHRLLPHADVTFLIAPHTPQTEGMIGAAELALLPDGALAGQRGPRQAGRHGRAGRRAGNREDPRGAGRDRSGAAAARSPALAPARGADLAARRRGQLSLLPARGPADGRAAEPLHGRPTTGERRQGPLGQGLGDG